MIRVASLVAVLAASGTAALSDVRPETDRLLQAMRFDDLISVMREEGIDYGAQLEEQLFPSRGGDAWSAIIEQTYDGERMFATFAEKFDTELDAETIATLTGFFTSDRGQRISELEISARRALLDETVEDAAIEAYEALRDDTAPRFDLVSQFIETNDLVEQNVMGAMNANYAFYNGLIEGNAFPRPLSEEQILADVWSQEEQIRGDTTEWVYSYLLMAYQPLSDEDLEVYIALSDSPEGRDLNRALFAAFDAVFVDISRMLGVSAARFLSGQDI